MPPLPGRRPALAGAVLVLALAPAAASAAPFRLTVLRGNHVPFYTFAADALPVGFRAQALKPPYIGIALAHPSGVRATVEVRGLPRIVPVNEPPARIAPDGATIAADGSWTLDGETHQFGRFSPDTGKKLWLDGVLFVAGVDIRDASPEQQAAIASFRAVFEPSVRSWYGLDPRTTSDGNRAAVIRAVAKAIHRTAALRDWSVTADEASIVPRPGPQTTHAVYAVRERRGKIALSSVDQRFPRVRRIHKPGKSWQYDPARRCWFSFRDVGGPPLPVRERDAVRSGPASLPLVGTGFFGLNSTILGSEQALRLAYDLTAKAPLSRGRRGTRYELFFYMDYRVHVIVDVNKRGVATVLKEEQLDDRGRVAERQRLGIVTPAPGKLLKPGRAC
jgi:hypothetical protein